MNKIGVVRPMRLWQSLLFFLVPGLYALFSQYVLFPSLVQLGVSEEYAYNTALLTGFVLLFLATIIALRVDGCCPSSFSAPRTLLPEYSFTLFRMD
jgi:hypothetical protein